MNPTKKKKEPDLSPAEDKNAAKPIKRRPSKFVILDDQTTASGSSLQSSPSPEAAINERLVEFMSCTTTGDSIAKIPNVHIYDSKINIPTSVPSSSPSPPNTSTSIYATPTTPSSASQFFPNTSSISHTSLQVTVTVTTKTCSVATTTSTTSTSSFQSTIVHSTPNSSVSQLSGNPNPTCNPKKNIHPKYKGQSSREYITDSDQQSGPSTSRPRRRPSPNIFIDTFVSPPPASNLSSLQLRV